MEHDIGKNIQVVLHPTLFKAKLGIGEEAYAFLRTTKNLSKLSDVIGLGAAGSAAASSSVVANTFFATHSIWSALGLGATASTPIGWVIAAGVASGVGYYGISKVFQKQKDGMVTVVPEFINTPLDLLAIGISNMVVPLALKIALADGTIKEVEKSHIVEYFTDEWGYAPDFIYTQIDDLLPKLNTLNIDTLTQEFATYIKENPDCHTKKMAQELHRFLKDIAICDGELHENERIAIVHIENLIANTIKFSFGEKFSQTSAEVKQAAKIAATNTHTAASKTGTIIIFSAASFGRKAKSSLQTLLKKNKVDGDR